MNLHARHSLRWRLPVIVCGLLALVLTTFLWAAHLQVKATLVRAAGDRAQVAADQLARLLDGQATLKQLDQISNDPLLRRFLESRSDEARDAAHARLSALSATGLRRIELWDAAGERVLETSTPPRIEEDGPSKVLPPGVPPFAPGIRPLQSSGDIVFTDIVAPIKGSNGILGTLLIRSTFTENPRGVFSRLVGRDALVRVGNRSNDIWTDFSGLVPRVPVDLGRHGVVEYRAANGEMRLGAVSHVSGTPWAAWAEFPLSTSVAPAGIFLSQMIPVAFVFLAIGAVVVNLLSARITRPLSELTNAAEAISTGDYSRRVAGGDRRDEIGRLGRTFNLMADQVQGNQQRLEARVAERTARLERANKELEAFSYSVSHDLRAPLRSIDGFSQALLEDSADKLNAKEKSHLQRVRAAAQRMGELIDDLLELSRVGRAPIRRDRVNLSQIGHDVAAELRKRDPQRQVQIDIAEGLVVAADRGLVQIVLENLIGNAWKFTRDRTPARLELGTKREASDADVYFVRDNGAGFDMSYMDKLFRPFQRLHSEAEFPGTGIGLATVQRIIDRHGGRIWAEGAVGTGATIYFTLPQGMGDA
jgi:signal transduction histidine kinase